MSGVFGWSYPPGCSGPPEEPDYPCPVCGKSEDECECPECSECGTIGCIEHIKSGEMAQKIRLLEYQLDAFRKEAKKRETESSPCPKCGRKHVIDIFLEDPLFCCGYEYSTTRGWVNYDHEWMTLP